MIFAGQGPDELWVGYDWYPEVLSQDGRQELCRRMWDDFSRADIKDSVYLSKPCCERLKNPAFSFLSGKLSLIVVDIKLLLCDSNRA